MSQMLKHTEKDEVWLKRKTKKNIYAILGGTWVLQLHEVTIFQLIEFPPALTESAEATYFRLEVVEGEVI